jgi:phytoene dehydrogenase-like protein
VGASERFDALVIGAGPSGLAAGLRVAQAGKRVAILERHSLWGGLNSFYKRAGRRIDVGLHALTNYVPGSVKDAPLPRVLRQLRVDRARLELGEQSYSQSVFDVGGELVRLRFANGGELLRGEVARLFPSSAGRFERFLAELPGYETAHTARGSARSALSGALREPLLEEMLLLPTCYYGSPSEGDLSFGQFAVLFRSLFLEGFCRPAGGVKRLLDLVLERLRAEGAQLRLRTPVERILVQGGAVRGVRTGDGSELLAPVVLSSAGWFETAALCPELELPDDLAPSELSFVEIFQVLSRTPAELGLEATVTFFNVGERFEYACPREPACDAVDVRSGVLCAPNNYATDEPLPEGWLRITVLANPHAFQDVEPKLYARRKARAVERALDAAARFAFDPRPHSLWSDAFTPRTIRHFSAHANGAVYGAPAKPDQGDTGLRGLGLIGTDQGYVGVVGAMLGGILQANRLVVAPSLQAAHA